MACTRGSRGGEPTRSQAPHCVAIAPIAAHPWVPASVVPSSGDRFVIASRAASTRRVARKLPVTTVGSWQLLEVTTGCFVDAKREKPRLDVGQLWRTPTGGLVSGYDGPLSEFSAEMRPLNLRLPEAAYRH